MREMLDSSKLNPTADKRNSGKYSEYSSTKTDVTLPSTFAGDEEAFGL
jgi:hypothetical protein